MAAELNDEKKQEVGDIHSRSSEQEHRMPRQATILIVDDDKAMRDSCCHTLTYGIPYRNSERWGQCFAEDKAGEA